MTDIPRHEPGQPQPAPAWLEPVTLAAWPTREVTSRELKYALPLPRRWNAVPQIVETPLDVTHIFTGDWAEERLQVSFMTAADPTHHLDNWVEAPLRLTGFPIPAASAADQPQLLEWSALSAPAALLEHLQIDEVHLYQGLGVSPIDPSRLSRLYFLLARRGTLAWKVGLSFMTACPPGMPEPIIAANDHVRAGATFGLIHFLE